MGDVKKIEMVPLGAGEGDAEVLLQLASQDQSQQQGDDRDIQRSEGDAQNSEPEHHKGIEERIPQRVTSNHAEHGNGRHENSLGEVDELDQKPRARQSNEERENVRNEEQNNDGVGEISLFHEEERAGGQSVDKQRPDQNRSHGITWNAQGHHGDERSAANGIVCGFGRGDPFHAPRSKLVGVLAQLFRIVVADERGDRPLRPRAGSR